MILADTSAWIEYLRGTGGAADVRLQDLVRQRAELRVTDVVVMEVLAGTAEAHLPVVRQMLLQFDWVPVEPVDYEMAAMCYRSCRWAGETVRALLDCLVAAVALRAGAAVLARDRDFDVLARHTGLQLDG